MRILVVEDDAEIREFIESTLRQEGHEPRGAATRAEAEDALRERPFDGAVLDWMLSDGSGLELCRAMRKAGHAMPVLMLSARSEVEDRVVGLDAGADDYLKKPFAAAELKARVRALLRRGPRLVEEVVRVGPVTIDFGLRKVTSPRGETFLTAREFAILEELARARGRVLSRGALLLAIWGSDDPSASGSFEVLVARLRRKLAAAGAPDAIRTHRGVGYSFQDDA